LVIGAQRSDTKQHSENPTKVPSRNTVCLPSDSELSSYTCSAPPEPLRISCIDTNTQCPGWARRGECSKNPQFMLLECRQSCSSCLDWWHDEYIQVSPDGSSRDKLLRKLIETQEYQHRQAERKVDSLKTCFNRHEMCTHWSLHGECDSNPTFMHKDCPAACQVC